MNQITTKEYDQIIFTINKYVEGVASGKSELLKEAFYENAIMYGFEDSGLVEGSIQNLYDYVDQAGPAPKMQSRIDIIEVVNTVATVRVILENSEGANYTDFHQLLKINNDWKIISKLFHRHS
ncbi:nuclear transport factor 2 family protein [Lysinibacillus capsici]